VNRPGVPAHRGDGAVHFAFPIVVLVGQTQRARTDLSAIPDSNNLHDAALAIGGDGKLVLAQGFGLTDTRTLCVGGAGKSGPIFNSGDSRRLMDN
jgi:hypothetical protein